MDFHECNKFGWFLMGTATGIIAVIWAVRGF